MKQTDLIDAIFEVPCEVCHGVIQCKAEIPAEEFEEFSKLMTGILMKMDLRCPVCQERPEHEVD